MIKAYDGTKITPKQKAKELISVTLGRVEYWTEFDHNEYQHMTQRELDEVERHIETQLERIRKLGFDI